MDEKLVDKEYLLEKLPASTVGHIRLFLKLGQTPMPRSIG